MVDYTKFSEVKAGEKTSTKVTEVNEGSQSDFRSEKYWAASDLSKAQIEEAMAAPAIEIVTANGAREVVNLPTNGKVSPKSKLGAWKRTYGDYPKVNQAVTTKTSDTGFQKIVLEV